MRRQSKAIIAVAALGVLAGVTMIRAQRRHRSTAELEAACGLAGVFCRHGDYDAAIQAYTALMKQTRNAPFVRLGLAGAYVGKGDLDKAEEQYRTLLAADPDSPVALFDLGQCLLLQKRQAEAAEPLRRFIAMYGREWPDLARQAEAAAVQPPL